LEVVNTLLVCQLPFFRFGPGSVRADAKYKSDTFSIQRLT
jgi:hypothetical protein